MARRIPLDRLIENAAGMEAQRGAAAVSRGDSFNAAEHGARLAELNAAIARLSAGASQKKKKSPWDRFLNGVATVTGANYVGNAVAEAINEQVRSSWGEAEARRHAKAVMDGRFDPAVTGMGLANVLGIVGRTAGNLVENLDEPHTATKSSVEELTKSYAGYQDKPVTFDGITTSLREARQGSNSPIERALASPTYDAVAGGITAAGADPVSYVVPSAGFTKGKAAAALIQADEPLKAAKVLRQGKSAISAAEYAAAGMEGAGGLRFFGVGPAIVPFSVTRQAGRLTAPLRTAVGDVLLDKGLYRFVGKGAELGANAPRVMARSGNPEKAIPAFTLGRENAVIRSMTAAEFGGLRDDFAKAFKDGRKGGWDYTEMVKWIETADPAAKSALARGRAVEPLERVSAGLSKVADKIETVYGYRPGVQDFFPRLYVGPAIKQAGRRAAGEMYDLFARRYKAGDTLSWGVKIPEGLDNAGVREFVEQSARDTFGSKQFYSDNPLVALDAYLHGAEGAVRKARVTETAVGKYGTGLSGVAADLLNDPAAARGARRDVVEALSRFSEQQAPVLKGMEGATGDIVSEMARLQKIGGQTAEGVAKATATSSLADQIGQLREFMALPQTTRAEANRAARLLEKLEMGVSFGDKMTHVLGDPVAMGMKTGAAERAGSSAAAAAARANQTFAEFADALRSKGFAAEVVDGWRQHAQRLADEMTTIPEKAVRRKATVREARRLYEEAASISDTAALQASEELQLVGVMDARAKSAWAEWTEQLALDDKIVDLTKPLSKKQIRALQEGLTAEWRRTVQAFGPDELPANIVGFTTEFEKAAGNVEQFFRNHYDPMINWIKARQLATPGFVLRNWQGGLFNNWIAGVKFASYKQYLGLRVNEGSLAKASVEDRIIYRHIRGMLGESQTLAGAEVNIPLFGSGNLRPWSPNFKPFRWVRKGNEITEIDLLRGPMLWDTLKRDQQLVKAIRSGDEAQIAARLKFASEEAMARVYKYHFDYSDLSNFEQRFMKRIIPFYTWTSRNLALQFEQLVAQPQKYYWKFKVENVVRSLSPEEPVVPEYWGPNKVRLPIKVGGSRLYYTPDLPFEAALGMVPGVGNPVETTLGSVAPPLKTPIEWWAQKQVYKDIPMTTEMKPAPSAWAKIPGLMPLLSSVKVPGTDLAFAKKGANGEYFMSDRNRYLVEQVLPEMARARRMAPSDKNSQARALSSSVSTLLGVRLRANTPAEVEQELTRQKYAKRDDAAQDKRYRKSGYKK